MRKIVCFVAVLGVSTAAATLNAQTSDAQDAARTESVVRDAMRSYNDSMKNSGQPPTGGDQSPIGRQTQGGTRELTLEDAVNLGLEKNLDIQVSRLEPQSVDLTTAGIRNTFRPVLSSTFGQRDQVQPPSSQLNGGASVTNGTTTYNFGVNQTVPWGGGNYLVGFTNNRLATNNLFANFNPSYNADPDGGLHAADHPWLQDRQHPAATRGVVDQPGNLRRVGQGHRGPDRGQRA